MQRRWLMVFIFTWLMLFVTPSTAHLQNGGAIAFSSDMDGDFDVYLLNLDDGQLINVSNNDDAYDGYKLAWSDDGRLAFMSGRRETYDTYVAPCIWTVDRVTCAPVISYIFDFDWSHDGRLAISSVEAVMVWDGVHDDLSNITFDDVRSVSLLDWSPNGYLMYSAEMNNGDHTVFIWDGSTTTRLIDTEDNIGFAWSADGRLVYRSDQNVPQGYYGGDLYIWDGEESMNITNTAEFDDTDQPHYTDPAWSIDSRLAFVMTQGANSGAIMVWDGKTLTTITHDQTQGYAQPTWSSDERLAFTTYTAGKDWALYVWDDGTQTLIHETGSMIRDLGWHKDGQRLLFTADDAQGSRQIYLWDGAVVEQLTDDSGAQHYGAVWMP